MKERLNRALERRLECSQRVRWGEQPSRAGIADLGTGGTAQVLRVDADSNLAEARAVLLTLVADCDKWKDQNVWDIIGVLAIRSSGDLGAPKGWIWVG